MTSNRIFSAFVWLYSLQLVAWVGLLGLAIYTATNFSALQELLTHNDTMFAYQLAFYFNPGYIILGLGVAFFIAVGQLKLSVKGLRAGNEATENQVANDLRNLVRSINRIVLPIGGMFLFTVAPLSLSTGLIGVATSAPVLVGVVIAAVAAWLRTNFVVPESNAEFKPKTSWFENTPEPAYFDYRGNAVESLQVTETTAAQEESVAPVSEPKSVSAATAGVAWGALILLAVNLLMWLGAGANYAPGGIGVAADIGPAVFHFLILTPIALYLIVKGLGLIERGGNKWLLLLAVAASIGSIFIVPVA